MTNDELLELCSDKNVDSGKCSWLYWTSEIYSQGKYIRKYGLFPKRLPLNIYSDHGAGVNGSFEPAKHEIENDAPVFFTKSLDKANFYKKITGKKAYIFISPAIYYRRKYKIKQKENASGTLAFPNHTTPSIELVDGVEKYCQQLNDLPKKYHPITICLHMHDINKGMHLDFQKKGFDVVTAGNTSDVRFIERFYDILSSFQFITSNSLGSYASLAIEMKLPFFIYGDVGKYINKGDPNLPNGDFNGLTTNPVEYKIQNALLFEKKKGQVDDDIYQFVLKETGVFDTIGRLHMCMILWQCYFLWLFKTLRIKLKRLFIKMSWMKEGKDD